MKLGLMVALGFAASVYAADACTDEMGHVGQGTTLQKSDEVRQTGDIGNSGYHYELWFQYGNGSMTYYDNGTFSAKWKGTNEFLVRVGRVYDGSKTFDQYGNFSADFKLSKTGTAEYSYIGIHGYTENPLVEFFIVEDWFSVPDPQYLGEKKGEFEVDGETYDVYTFIQNNHVSAQGNKSYPMFYSVRRTARQCGHVDITAHFKKWDELGLKLGNISEIKMLAEAGGNASVEVDFTYVNIAEADASITAMPLPARRSVTDRNVKFFDLQGRHMQERPARVNKIFYPNVH